MNARLVIFDFDGTLADTRNIILSTYTSTIEKLGLPTRTTAQLQATIGIPLQEGFENLYPSLGPSVTENCCATYRDIFNKNKHNYIPELFPGVTETLETLAKRGTIMTIASSRSHDSLIECCKENGIDHYFSIILGADNVERAKPDPWPVTHTLSRLGIPASDAVVVGDMPFDIKMGMDAGCRTVGVSYGNSTVSNLIEAGANRVINSISLLPDLEL